MTTSIGRVYVGASGFSYPSWRGGFYPPGTASGDFLSWYAGRLPAVELNSTVYRLPSEATVEAWAAATPPEFRFAAKLPSRPGTAAELVRRLARLGGRLGPVRAVVESPRDDALLARLLDALGPDIGVALDLRDPSWDSVELPVTAMRVGATEGTAGFRYLRFRDPPYDEAALADSAAEIRPLLDAGIDVYAFFRHEDEPTAPRYAARLLQLLDP